MEKKADLVLISIDVRTIDRVLQYVEAITLPEVPDHEIIWEGDECESLPQDHEPGKTNNSSNNS